MNLPDLHLVVPHDKRNRDRWMTKLLRLQKGQSYFLAVISDLSGKEYLEALLSQCPDTRDLLAGLDYSNLKERVISRCGLWMQLRESEDRSKSSRRLFPTGQIATKDFEGMAVSINDHGGINFHWLRDDRTTRVLQLTAKYAKPTRPETYDASSLPKKVLTSLMLKVEPFVSSSRSLLLRFSLPFLSQVFVVASRATTSLICGRPCGLIFTRCLTFKLLRRPLPTIHFRRRMA